MNRSSKFNFFLPQNTDPIEVSDFNSNFETIDANLLTKAQSLTEAQKAAVRANADLNVANNLTTTAAGSVLDARQGKILGDKLAFPNTVRTLTSNDNLNNLYNESDSGWYSLQANVQNAPANWCRMLVIGGAGCAQIVITATEIIIRMYTGSPLAWTTWRRAAMRSNGGFSGYIPAITAGTGFEVSNVLFNYMTQGNMLFVSGRFNITNYGEAQKTIVISLPPGMTAYMSGVGPCGSVFLNKDYSKPGLSVRCDGGNYVYIQAGAGGYCTDLVGTGYVMVNFTCFIQ